MVQDFARFWDIGPERIEPKSSLQTAITFLDIARIMQFRVCFLRPSQACRTRGKERYTWLVSRVLTSNSEHRHFWSNALQWQHRIQTCKKKGWTCTKRFKNPVLKGARNVWHFELERFDNFGPSIVTVAHQLSLDLKHETETRADCCPWARWLFFSLCHTLGLVGISLVGTPISLYHGPWRIVIVCGIWLDLMLCSLVLFPTCRVRVVRFYFFCVPVVSFLGLISIWANLEWDWTWLDRTWKSA